MLYPICIKMYLCAVICTCLVDVPSNGYNLMILFVCVETDLIDESVSVNEINVDFQPVFLFKYCNSG